jgi:hypothetical protein
MASAATEHDDEGMEVSPNDNVQQDIEQPTIQPNVQQRDIETG